MHPVMHPALKRALVSLVLLLLPACASTLKSSRVSPDYAQADRASLKRLRVLTAPVPAGVDPQLGELWSRVARRYVNQKRNFIAKAHGSLPTRPDADALRAACTEEEGLEGLLWLEPTQVTRVGKGPDAGVEAAVHAQLLRCRDLREVWAADAAGSFASEDAQLKESAALWTQGLEPSVEPYAAPAFRLLRPLLDSLPEPTPPSSDEETIEKGEAELF
jgi:probable lipoprotein (TIGR04455 family)